MIECTGMQKICCVIIFVPVILMTDAFYFTYVAILQIFVYSYLHDVSNLCTAEFRGRNYCSCVSGSVKCYIIISIIMRILWFVRASQEMAVAVRMLLAALFGLNWIPSRVEGTAN